jgi:hypothetical protein
MATVTTDGRLDDNAPGQIDRISVAAEYTRQELSLEGSYDVAEMATLGFGWQWEQWDRSSSRQVSETNEQGPMFRVDLRPAKWARIRTSYEFTTRRRSGYEPFSYLYESYNSLLIPNPAQEVFPDLRRFPQSDRRRHQLSFLALLVPCDTVDVNVSGGFDVSDYGRSDFGLTNDEFWNVGLDVGWRPIERVELSAYYTYAQGLLKQESRERPVAGGMVIDLPINDWSSHTKEKGYNAGLSAWAALLPDVLDVDFSYDFQRGTSETHSGGPNRDAVDWPTTKNNLHLLAASLTWHALEQVDVTAMYRFERFTQRDFQRNDLPPTIGNNILLSPDVGQYKASIYGLALTYKF